MTGTEAPHEGGIDFKSADKNLEVQNPNGEIQFYIDPAQLAQLQNAPGFVPVIINMEPITDIKGFLGIVEANSQVNSTV